MKNKISKAAQHRTEKAFSEYVTANDLKPETIGYRKAQHSFFMGAMNALNGQCAFWSICLMSGREILLESNRFNNGTHKRNIHRDEKSSKKRVSAET